MTRLIIPLILISALGILRCKPIALNPQEEAPHVYHAALDQIIAKYLMARCMQEPYPGFSEKIYNDYRTGKIDSSRYYQAWDSLFTIRKNQLPKCTMEFSPLFSAFQSESDLQCSMIYALHDDFFYEHFRNTPVYAIVDTLTRNTPYNWKDISPPYMDFIKHDSSDHRHPYGKNNTGVIALSAVYFNKAADHAIIFFEFAGSHQYQRGELIFLEKTSGYWKAVRFRTIWIT